MEKNMRNSKKFAIVVCFILALLMIMSVVFPVLMNIASAAPKVTQSDISKANDKLDGLQNDLKQLEKDIKDIKAQAAGQLREKEALDKKVANLQQQIEIMDELIANLSDAIEQKEQELEIATQTANDQYALLTGRIRTTYETGTVSYLEVLFASKTYSDFLVYSDIVSSLVNYDKKVLNDYNDARDRVEEAKIELEENKAAQQEVKANMELALADLNAAVEESVAAIKKFEADRKQMEAEYKKVEQEQEKVKAEIKKMIAELSKGEYVGGTFTWPTPGYTKITSEYGMRWHPTLGGYRMHTGIDIAASSGSQILAANSGKIIKSEYNTAYGNYVAIDHGGGYVTLYAHMIKATVKVGDIVTKGDKIGLVGSTGYSTGPHLHIEVIINGETKNPEDHLKNKR